MQSRIEAADLENSWLVSLTVGILHAVQHSDLVQRRELLLGQRSDDMRNNIVWSLDFARSELDFLPLASGKEPLICWSLDIATVKEVRPDIVDDS